MVLARNGLAAGPGIRRPLQGGKLDVRIDGRQHQNGLRARRPSLQSAARTHDATAEKKLDVTVGRILVEKRQRGEGRRLGFKLTALAGRRNLRGFVGCDDFVVVIRIVARVRRGGHRGDGAGHIVALRAVGGERPERFDRRAGALEFDPPGALRPRTKDGRRGVGWPR